VTQVTHKPEHATDFADMRLLGMAKNSRCLVDNRGNLMDAGMEFCEAKGIKMDYFSLVQYMHEVDTMSSYLRRKVTVRKPLRLKA
jgi:hypothetical protein